MFMEGMQSGGSLHAVRRLVDIPQLEGPLGAGADDGCWAAAGEETQILPQSSETLPGLTHGPEEN